MTRDQQLLYLVAALFAASPEVVQAATVTRTTTAPISASQSSATFSFAPIVNADQLVSISGGSAASGEGTLTFSISADYSGGAVTQFFSTQAPQFFSYDLTSVPATSFATGTLTGLTFAVSSTSGFGNFLSIPTGTVFTFDVANPAAPPVSGAPEPAAWAELMAGLAALGLTMRVLNRRRETSAAPA